MPNNDGTERRVRFITDLTALTLMVDKGLVTAEEAVERLGLIQSVLPDTHQDPLVARQLGFVIAFLRSKGPSPLDHRWTPTVVEGGLSDPAADDPKS